MALSRRRRGVESTADVLVLLVDARKGVLEQTRRHLAVAALLRVPHVVVAVNKIDLVGFSQEAFDQLEQDNSPENWNKVAAEFSTDASSKGAGGVRE